jgi:hypothetical protein
MAARHARTAQRECTTVTCLQRLWLTITAKALRDTPTLIVPLAIVFLLLDLVLLLKRDSLSLVPVLHDMFRLALISMSRIFFLINHHSRRVSISALSSRCLIFPTSEFITTLIVAHQHGHQKIHLPTVSSGIACFLLDRVDRQTVILAFPVSSHGQTLAPSACSVFSPEWPAAHAARLY